MASPNTDYAELQARVYDTRAAEAFQDIAKGLQQLLDEFESLKNRLRSDRIMSAFTASAGLQRTLDELQTMAATLQHKIDPMQRAFDQMKDPNEYTPTPDLLSLLSELRTMCEEFSRKLIFLRMRSKEALQARRRVRSRTITIDCTSLVVLVLFLLFVGVSKLCSSSDAAENK